MSDWRGTFIFHSRRRGKCRAIVTQLIWGLTSLTVLGFFSLLLVGPAEAATVHSTPVQRSKKPASKTPAAPPAHDAAQQQAIAAFEAGQRAHEQGELQKAIEHYSEALGIIEKFPEALYQRGIAHLALKQLDSAQADLLRLTELQEEILQSDTGSTQPQARAFFARARTALGDIFAERNDSVKAESQYRQAVELDPTFQRATTSLATMLINRKAFSEATTVLQPAVQAATASASMYNLLGYALEQSQQLDAALENYSKAIEQEPRNVLARQRRSHLRADRHDDAGAIEDFTIVYEQDRSTTNALELGALYERAKKPAEAIRLYESVLTSGPSTETTRVRLKLIELLISAERRDEALAQAQPLISDSTKDAAVLSQLGVLLLPVDPAQAAQAYQRALTLDPENADNLLGLSAALLMMKHYQDALVISQQAVKRAPENYYAHSNLATALFQLQQFAQAADHFNWIIEHRPETAIAYYFLGICYDKLMEYELALPAYERFLEKADASQHQAEIDSVIYRLPGVRRMIEKNRGQRKKR